MFLEKLNAMPVQVLKIVKVWVIKFSGWFLAKMSWLYTALGKNDENFCQTDTDAFGGM